MTIGPQADVRALGVTMRELLTRQRLFGEAEDERQLASWVLTRDVPNLREVDSTIDADLDAINAWATARAEEERIQTARKLAEYIDPYLHGQPLPIRNPGTAEAIRRAIFSETRFKETMEKWACVFIVYAVFFFIGVAATVYIQAGNDLPWSFPLACVWLVGIVTIAWFGRFRSGGPLIYVERQAARIWLLLIAGLLLTAVLTIVVANDMNIRDGYRFFLPTLTILVGVGFACTATLLGGSFYQPAILCVITAALMVAFPQISPILCGIVVALCLLVTGLKYLTRGPPVGWYARVQSPARSNATCTDD